MLGSWDCMKAVTMASKECVCVRVRVQGAMDVVLAWAPLANSWRLGMRAF